MPQFFSVAGFTTALGRGGVRPNQFRVILTPPTRAELGAAGLETSSFLCSAASLPGQTLNPAIVYYRGREVKLAGDRVFAPWTATFLNDTGFSARTICERWMNIMEDREEKVGLITPSTYYGTVRIQQLDRNGGILRSYTLTRAFPVDISEVALDYGANDQVSTFTCTWQYQQFDEPTPRATILGVPVLTP